MFIGLMGLDDRGALFSPGGREDDRAQRDEVQMTKRLPQLVAENHRSEFVQLAPRPIAKAVSLAFGVHLRTLVIERLFNEKRCVAERALVQKDFAPVSG